MSTLTVPSKRPVLSSGLYSIPRGTVDDCASYFAEHMGQAGIENPHLFDMLVDCILSAYQPHNDPSSYSEHFDSIVDAMQYDIEQYEIKQSRPCLDGDKLSAVCYGGWLGALFDYMARHIHLCLVSLFGQTPVRVERLNAPHWTDRLYLKIVHREQPLEV
jgi:hypothetical protein